MATTLVPTTLVPTALIIVGLVFLIVGLIVFVIPSPGLSPQTATKGIAEILKQVNALLDKFDKRYRPGLALMLIGLALVCLGIYLETVKTKNAAPKTAAVVVPTGRA
jgi:uncharacterized membrane protein